MTPQKGNTVPRCHYCGQPDEFPDKPKSELRPYGPGGAMVCAGCGLDGGAREAEAKSAFLVLSDAESTFGPVVITDNATRKETS